MRTDFNASSVAPWGARARGPAARCRSCGSTVNRWLMSGFPEKRWELDCCRGGRSGAVLKGARAIGRVDIVLPRGWTPEDLKAETESLIAGEYGPNWTPLQVNQYETIAAGAGVAGGSTQGQTAQASEEKPADPAPREPVEPEPETTEDEPFPLLPSIPFGRA